MLTPIRKDKRDFFIRKLRQWFKKNGRTYPWRRTKDPYKILVSEFLLQQTNADLALAAYKQFIKDYPTPASLAKADVRHLRKLIAPIGLSYRAGRLKTIGKQIVSNFNGKVPHLRNELLKLHGVGLYMSNAVLCFAYEEAVPILDTNTIRIFARVFGIVSNHTRPRTDRSLEKQMSDYLPNHGIRDFNYALLDFGALICTTKTPRCRSCPINKKCLYFRAVY
jgi:A/G-specific adenine glycosylase